MTESKRFTITRSHLVGDCYVLVDSEKQYTFPVTGTIASSYMFFKALNELNDENKRLRGVIEDIIGIEKIIELAYGGGDE